MELLDTEISFQRFHKVDKFYWSPDKTFFSLLLFTLFYTLFLGNQLPEWLEGYARVSVVLLFFIYFVYRLFKRYFEYEVLKGYVEGEIKFGMQSIEFDGYQYSIEAIKNISFSFRDKKGDALDSMINSYSVNGLVSNGIDNSVTITFKEGKTVTVYFQVPYIFKIKTLKPILISYAQSNLMSFRTLCDMLGLHYKEVEELKQ
jgi:hypothetical protein